MLSAQYFPRSSASVVLFAVCAIHFAVNQEVFLMEKDPAGVRILGQMIANIWLMQ